MQKAAVESPWRGAASPCVHAPAVRRRCCARAAAGDARPAGAGSTERRFNGEALSRRSVLWLSAAVGMGLPVWPAMAFRDPPPGFRSYTDVLDGYTFVVPEDWVRTTTAGNDVAFRDPVNVDKNLFVNLSSPSSSKYAVVSDLGSPQDAAQRILQQYLAEFMSTRIGVQREGDIISAEQRTGPDGKLYYDVQIRLRSYASRNPLAVTSQERDMGVELEWDRLLIAVLGVANKRLYEMRLQTNFDVSESELSKLGQTAVSFECQEV